MLGGQCSVCCGKCGCKPPAKLPYTMTVTFAGLQNRTRGQYCNLIITSPVGSGAAGVLTAPGGCRDGNDPMCCEYGTDESNNCNETATCDPSDRGPLAGVLLTEPGSGYVTYRTAPTLSVGGGSGQNAAFTVTLSEAQCAWSVQSIAVSGGHDYEDGDSLTITAASGDTVVTPATATLHTERGEPTLTASVAGGTGASLAIVYSGPNGSPSEWTVESITVSSGGSGYSDGDEVAFTLGADDHGAGATATIQTNRIEPTLSASVSGSGSGAVLSVSMAQSGGNWSVSAVSVTTGGSGYAQGDPVAFSITDGQQDGVAAFAVVGGVDGSGAVTAITIYDGGQYFKDGGVIESVEVTDGGSYWRDTGVPESVTVGNAGQYFRTDPDAEPCSSVTVSATSTFPCNGGTGANVSAQVDTDINSPTHGQVTGFTIENAGSSYLAWNWIHTCREKINGVPIVLRAKTPIPLISLSFDSCYGSGAQAHVVPLGERTQPDICLTGVGTGGTITATLSEQSESDSPCLPYWTIDTADATGGYGYRNGEIAFVHTRGATTETEAEVTLQATGNTVEDPPDITNDRVLTGATVVSGGKFFVQHDWDGEPTELRRVVLDEAGSGYAKLGREEPALTILCEEGSHGTGATFTPTWTQHQDECGLDYWTVESVAVSGGACYGMAWGFGPALTASTSSGSGATLTVSTEEIPGGCGWRIASISVTLGTNYTNGSAVAITAGSGVVVQTAATATLQVDENGVPTGVTVTNPGVYLTPVHNETLRVSPATSGDKVQSPATLTLQSDDDGVPTGVTVVNGGKYYRENAELQPYVADVQVVIHQTAPSDGSGAVITATVGNDPSDAAHFGKITSLTLADCGSGYQPLGGPLDCEYLGPCGVGLKFRGKGREAYLSLSPGVFKTDDPLDDCDSLPTSASVFHSIGEGSATLSPGGTFDSTATLECCVDCNPCPDDRCGKPQACLPCTGTCDQCNKCSCGCVCVEGKCEPCCGSCDEETPCPSGCECVDGRCTQECEPCACEGTLTWNWTDHVEATATVKFSIQPTAQGLSNCEPKTQTVTIPLVNTDLANQILGCVNIPLEPTDTFPNQGRRLSVTSGIACYSGVFETGAWVSVEPCDPNSGFPACGLGCEEGSFLSVGAFAYSQPETVRLPTGERVCFPKSGGTRTTDEDFAQACVSVQYSIDIKRK